MAHRKRHYTKGGSRTDFKCKGFLDLWSFFGYTFLIRDVRYSGLFVIIGNEDQLSVLQDKLAGASFGIRYDPSDPNISVVVDLYDPRFHGLSATQDPEWLKQAPSFNLMDAWQK